MVYPGVYGGGGIYRVYYIGASGWHGGVYASHLTFPLVRWMGGYTATLLTLLVSSASQLAFQAAERVAEVPLVSPYCYF